MVRSKISVFESESLASLKEITNNFLKQLEQGDIVQQICYSTAFNQETLRMNYSALIHLIYTERERKVEEIVNTPFKEKLYGKSGKK